MVITQYTVSMDMSYSKTDIIELTGTSQLPQGKSFHKKISPEDQCPNYYIICNNSAQNTKYSSPHHWVNFSWPGQNRVNPITISALVGIFFNRFFKYFTINSPEKFVLYNNIHSQLYLDQGTVAVPIPLGQGFFSIWLFVPKIIQFIPNIAVLCIWLDTDCTVIFLHEPEVNHA